MKEFLYTLHLTLCGAMGRAPNLPPEGTDWKKVIGYSLEQNVFSLVFCAVDSRKADFPQAVYAFLKNKAFPVMVRNDIRRESVFEILKGAYEKGISPVVIKGAAIADCYANPSARWSCDTDIFISEGSEQQMEEYLEKECSMMAPREKHMHHSTFKQQNAGVIELHTHLFSKHAFSLWLSDSEILKKPEDYIYKAELGGAEVMTLKPLVHYIYICCHMLNHFVNTGMNMQMFADVAAFYEKHKSEISAERFESEMRAVNGEKLMKAVFRIIAMAGFDVGQELFSGVKKDNDAIHGILKDLCQGGMNGSKDFYKRNKQSGSVVEKKVSSNSGNAGRIRYRIKHKAQRVRSYFFPSRAEIRNKFENQNIVAAYFLYVSDKLSAHKKNMAMIKSENDSCEREQLLEKLGLL